MKKVNLTALCAHVEKVTESRLSVKRSSNYANVDVVFNHIIALKAFKSYEEMYRTSLHGSVKRIVVAHNERITTLRSTSAFGGMLNKAINQ